MFTCDGDRRALTHVIAVAVRFETVPTDLPLLAPHKPSRQLREPEACPVRPCEVQCFAGDRCGVGSPPPLASSSASARRRSGQSGYVIGRRAGDCSASYHWIDSFQLHRLEELY